MLLDAGRIARIAGHSFLSAPINARSTVIDLGVSEGAFSAAMVARFGCRVIGVEPVPHLFAALGSLPGVTVEQLAITADGAPAKLFINPSTCATIDARLTHQSAEEVEVPATTLGHLMDRHGIGRAALVKVDIEAAEHAMIDNAPLSVLQRVDQFTVEFHDFLDPGLAAGVEATRQRLRAAGFADFSLSRDNQDVLFVNRAQIRFGVLQRATAALFQKYPRGVKRRLDRRLQARRRRAMPL